MKHFWIGVAILMSWLIGTMFNGGQIAMKCSIDNEFSYAGRVYICAPLIPTDLESEQPTKRPTSI